MASTQVFLSRKPIGPPLILGGEGRGSHRGSRAATAYGAFVRRVPWWGLVSSIAAPLLLIGGWTLAAGMQPIHFDAVMRAISDLAAHDTPHRWLMTGALVGVGLSYLATASALGCARTAGRLVLGLGGLATLLVAAFPLPAGDRSSAAHTAAATAAFVSLAVWPAFAWEYPLTLERTVPVLSSAASIRRRGLHAPGVPGLVLRRAGHERPADWSSRTGGCRITGPVAVGRCRVSSTIPAKTEASESRQNGVRVDRATRNTTSWAQLRRGTIGLWDDQ
jgi:hypothetical protein